MNMNINLRSSFQMVPEVLPSWWRHFRLTIIVHHVGNGSRMIQSLKESSSSSVKRAMLAVQ